MLQNYFPYASSGFLVHSTKRNAPYIHWSHDSILELWRSFRNEVDSECYNKTVLPEHELYNLTHLF